MIKCKNENITFNVKKDIASCMLFIIKDLAVKEYFSIVAF